MKQSLRLYKRAIDSGHGQQTVETDEKGTVTGQWLGPTCDQSHSYTGTGNPEFVGQNIRALRDSGFERVRMSDEQYLDYVANK
jgi:hypothetical protein